VAVACLAGCSRRTTRARNPRRIVLYKETGVKSEHEPSAHCLDAETMAAWVDRALPAGEAAAAEAHVADCARCQAVLSVLVKTMPAVAQPVPWWRRGWAIGTLVPLAGGALAIALWVATPRQPASLPAATSTTSVTSTTSPTVALAPPAAPGPQPARRIRRR